MLLETPEASIYFFSKKNAHCIVQICSPGQTTNGEHKVVDVCSNWFSKPLVTRASVRQVRVVVEGIAFIQEVLEQPNVKAGNYEPEGELLSPDSPYME